MREENGCLYELEIGGGHLCLTNLMAFYDKMTVCMDKEKAADVITLCL